MVPLDGNARRWKQKKDLVWLLQLGLQYRSLTLVSVPFIQGRQQPRILATGGMEHPHGLGRCLYERPGVLALNRGQPTAPWVWGLRCRHDCRTDFGQDHRQRGG